MIEINTIPQEKQRYNTIGDWYFVVDAITGETKKMVINVSDLANKDYEFAIALHELVEAYICVKRGITQKMVDEFDFNFKGEGEPGEQPAAPYYKEHQFASIIEHMIINELGINWAAFNKELRGG